MVLVLIKIIDNNLTTSGKELVVGEVIYITKRVEIMPAVDFLVLTLMLPSRSSDSKFHSKKSSSSKKLYSLKKSSLRSSSSKLKSSRG